MTQDLKILSAVEADLFFTRKDSSDPRLGELSKSLSLEDFLESTHPWGVIGYPDDEGIALSGGRLGAKLAPDRIRKFFYKMTPSLFSSRMEGLADLGNLITNSELSERHRRAREITARCYAQGKKIFSLGGGHDYGYADVAGFLDSSLFERPLILNFDAHLDVRPLDRGLSSGTPFYRILSEFQGGYDFVEVGIQAHCNSQNHLRWAQSQGAHILFYEEIRSQGLLKSLEPFFKERRNVFLSLDIDAFTSSEAPGCSQSWTPGLRAEEVISCFQSLSGQMDVRGVGIYEVSPPLDVDDRTSKLAAVLMHQLFHL